MEKHTRAGDHGITHKLLTTSKKAMQCMLFPSLIGSQIPTLHSVATLISIVPHFVNYSIGLLHHGHSLVIGKDLEYLKYLTELLSSTS